MKSDIRSMNFWAVLFVGLFMAIAVFQDARYFAGMFWILLTVDYFTWPINEAAKALRELADLANESKENR